MVLMQIDQLHLDIKLFLENFFKESLAKVRFQTDLDNLQLEPDFEFFNKKVQGKSYLKQLDWSQ